MTWFVIRGGRAWHWLGHAAGSVLAWCRRSSKGQLRVAPRVRAVQLATAALATVVLSIVTGAGIETAAPPRASSAHTQAVQAKSTEKLAEWSRTASAQTGVPARALRAYVRAARATEQRQPGCTVPWTLLAGIGRVESRHGQFNGAVLLPNGRPSHPIIGIPLDGGAGVQEITDTDNGRLDGDPVHDRAVGPMQFIPTTWQNWSIDGNDDGIVHPQSLDDAAATAGNYLCDAVDGQALVTTKVQRRALMAYNQSATYGSEVLSYAEQYAKQAPAPPSRLG